MIKKSLINTLYSYNVHIGHFDHFNTLLDHYMIGRRHLFYIIDINKVFLLLKKVLFLLKKLSLNNSDLLFFYNRFFYLDIMYKCVLLSLSKACNQQMITYPWKYGFISNYFFSFYILIKKVLYTWGKNNSLLFTLEKKLNYYYYNFHSNIDEKKANSFNYFFLDSGSLSKNSLSKKRKQIYGLWYKSWIKNKSLYSFWKYRKDILKRNRYLKQLFLNTNLKVYNKYNKTQTKGLFLKIFYFIYVKKDDPMLLGINIDDFNFKPKDLYHKKFLSYWRYILYFKYFNNFSRIPDCIFTILPDNNDSPLYEWLDSNLISIGLVDTASKLDNIHYPIISNDDSLLIILFFFNLISNVFLENKLNFYRLLNN